MFDTAYLIALTLAYFLFIFLLANYAEKEKFPRKLLNHPLIYALSLGGYTGSWAISGALSVAGSEGYLFLSYFFGTAALFIFSPLLIKPLYLLTKTYRLNSLADVFSFRYDSYWAGVIMAIFTVVCVLPLMAIQVDKLAETAVYLRHTGDAPLAYEDYRIWSWCFFIGITGFALLFGSDAKSHSGRHDGLVFATAVQSFIKLTCFLAIGCFAIFMVFDGPMELEYWLNANPAKLNELNSSMVSNNARTLIIIFFAASIAFPHLFHLTFSENPSSKSIDTASWAFPAYLLLLSLPILPILWAAEASGVNSADYLYAVGLGLAHKSPIIVMLAYFCMLAAAASSLTIISISTASMCTNHLILPFLSRQSQMKTFRHLGLIRGLLIIFILTMSMVLLEWTKQMPKLTYLSFAAFSAACQFLPGILAVLYWPRGNRLGLIAGLIVGFISWFVAIVLPLLSEDAFGLMPLLIQSFSLSPNSYFTVATSATLGVNMIVFLVISYITKTDSDQRYMAELCAQDSLSLPVRRSLNLRSAEEFIPRLAEAIGTELANKEVHQATLELKMRPDETRPFALRLLRRQIQYNLSGLFGPTVARQIVAEQLPYDQDEYENKDIRLIEETLETNKNALSGLAFELDRLRRFHRNTIINLPIGICTLGHDQEILLWNKTLETLTGQTAENLLGANISRIATPWQQAFTRFLQSPAKHSHKVAIPIEETTRWFTFHRTAPEDNQGFFQANNRTLIVEEVTELVMLENEVMHNERLASIGKLAAGVAHEIGNPVTGIACVAQNLSFDSDEPAVLDSAKTIIEQTQRITRIVQSLVSFAHAGEESIESIKTAVNLAHCAEDAINLLALENREIKSLIDNRLTDEAMIIGDPQRILQVFINLLNNALAASDNTAKIIIDSRTHRNTIECRVTDYGPGIDKAIQSRIFDPFFTTKDVGSGTGLGLSLVYSIIEDHHGSIHCQSPIDDSGTCGTRFILQLPKFGEASTETNTKTEAETLS